MRDRLNILSIDWDYFIKATMNERCELFPDGGNERISKSLRDVIWVGRYSGNSKLKEIGVDNEALRDLESVLEKCDVDKCMIVDSHRHIYDFVKEYCSENVITSINLVNVDFHHDVYNNDNMVNCGNWLRVLMDDFVNSKYTWVARDDSDKNFESLFNTLDITSDREILTEYDWDLLFVCKSEMWSPPHLDSYFKEEFEWLLSYFEVVYQEGIFNNRYLELEKDIENLTSEIKGSGFYDVKNNRKMYNGV